MLFLPKRKCILRIMNRISERITEKLLKLDIIAEEDREIYSYGFHQIGMAGMNIISTLILGALFHMIGESAFLMLFYIPIRRYVGGYHARTPFRCYLMSMGIIVCALLGIQSMVLHGLVSMLVLVVLGIFVFFLCPIPDANKPLSKGECKAYKRKSIGIYGAECIIYIIGSFAGGDQILNVMTWANIVLLAVLLLGLLRNRFTK